MLDGMPSPLDLHRRRVHGGVVGVRVVAEYDEGDLAMRAMLLVTLRRLGFPGGRRSEVFGLRPTCSPRRQFWRNER
jgi:hypothetical protein